MAMLEISKSACAKCVGYGVLLLILGVVLASWADREAVADIGHEVMATVSGYAGLGLVIVGAVTTAIGLAIRLLADDQDE